MGKDVNWQELSIWALTLWLSVLSFFGKRHLDAFDKAVITINNKVDKGDIDRLAGMIERHAERNSAENRAILDRLDTFVHGQTNFNLDVTRDIARLQGGK